MRGKPDPNSKISFIHQDRLEKGDEFWALRNINLEIEEGEIVGIIGRNGAGKSTLLKILSQITAPTEGKIHVNGRMASLLEVGTGFHPELTGRENVYLNGAILGMSRREVSKKFDEIVAFSEVEEFIDTPVKRYSSGMYVRLAFSVAAHLEPEILIVDEVLAVGDAAFQNKCIGKMGEANSNGRTILIVSHNMATISGLCKKCVLLSEGRVQVHKGETTIAIQKYLEDAKEKSKTSAHKRQDRHGAGLITISDIKLTNHDKIEQDNFLSGGELNIEIKYKINSKKKELFDIAVWLSNSKLGNFCRLSTDLKKNWTTKLDKNTAECKISKLPFPAGVYFISVSIRTGSEIQDYLEDVCILNVEAGDFYRTGKANPITHRENLFLVEHEWT